MMNSDDPTDKQTNNDETENTTQPTITAVFRLLSEVRDRQARLEFRFESFESKVNSRFESFESNVSSRFESFESNVNSRFESFESNVNSRFEALESRIDTRFAEMSEEMKRELLQLSDKLCDRIDLIRLHTDAGYEDLARRLRKLESKAS
jgi:hypothetical protein